MSFLNSKYLGKPFLFKGWRRSHRPSMHDISIIDEEEERDPELGPDSNTIANTQCNSQLNVPQPAYTITK
jgi:hypothetical protein